MIYYNNSITNKDDILQIEFRYDKYHSNRINKKRTHLIPNKIKTNCSHIDFT